MAKIQFPISEFKTYICIVKQNIDISVKNAVNHSFTAKVPALLLVLLMLFVAKNDLIASNQNKLCGTGSSSDTLYQPISVVLTPCSDILFVLPSETAVTPPTSNGRVLARDNGAPTSYNLRNQSSKYAVGPRYQFLYAIRHGYAFPHNSFERSIDFYVYFLNVLRL